MVNQNTSYTMGYYGNETFEEWCSANPYSAYKKKRQREQVQRQVSAHNKGAKKQRLHGRAVFRTKRALDNPTVHCWTVPDNNNKQYLLVVEGTKHAVERPYYLDELEASSLPQSGRALEVLDQPMRSGRWTLVIHRPFSTESHLLTLSHESFLTLDTKQYHVSKVDPSKSRNDHNFGPSAFLGSISLALFDGFESLEDSRSGSKQIAEQILNRSRSQFTTTTTKFIHDDKGLLTIPVDLDRTAKYQLKMYCDDSHRIVGVDVVFPYTRWSLGSSDHLVLTERNLKHHTSRSIDNTEDRRYRFTDNSNSNSSSFHHSDFLKRIVDDGLSLTESLPRVTPHPTTQHRRVTPHEPQSPPQLRNSSHQKNLFGNSNDHQENQHRLDTSHACSQPFPDDDDNVVFFDEPTMNQFESSTSKLEYQDAVSEEEETASSHWPSFHDVFFGVHDELEVKVVQPEQLSTILDDDDNCADEPLFLHDALFGNSMEFTGDGPCFGRFVLSALAFLFMVPLMFYAYSFLLDALQPSLPWFAMQNLGDDLPVQ